MSYEHLRPGDPTTRLDSDRRARELASLASRGVDVLVIGGGITGAGVALDAASRGLSVALVERHDLAHGTSRWSSKLIHGGLRYLVKGDVGIAWESAVERALIGERIAPHLVRPLTQVVPEYHDSRLDARAARLGFFAGDLLRLAARTKRGLIPHGRHLNATQTLQLVPALDRTDLRGSAVGADLQLEDDARMVIAVARTAAAFGAQILTRTAVASVNGSTAELRDMVSGTEFTATAGTIVNATGVWAGELDDQVRLSPSRGTHIVVRSARLGNSTASLAVPVPGHFGRMVFTLPQPDGLTYIGLTDDPEVGPIPDVPVATTEDVAWILEVISAHLAEPLTEADVVGQFAGLRPLLAGAQQASADLSRRHALTVRDSMITITGGKFTAYRAMAEEVVNHITSRKCRTRSLPLIGAGPCAVDDTIPTRLWRRYGSEAPLVWSLGAHDPGLRQPLAAEVPTLGVEIAFGAQWEGASTVADLLDRRTRIGLVPADADLVRDRVTEIMTGQSRLVSA